MQRKPVTYHDMKKQKEMEKLEKKKWWEENIASKNKKDPKITDPKKLQVTKHRGKNFAFFCSKQCL